MIVITSFSPLVPLKIWSSADHIFNKIVPQQIALALEFHLLESDRLNHCAVVESLCHCNPRGWRSSFLSLEVHYMVIVFLTHVGEMLAQTNEVRPSCNLQIYVIHYPFFSQGTNSGILIGDMLHS